MLNLEYIKSSYPPLLHGHLKDIFREYLQYKILDYIFSCPESKKICFIWWTALRIWYNNQRFSEDLDFDNWWLNQKEFEKIANIVKKWLEKEWYEVELRFIYKWAFHCEIKIPKILYDNKLSNMYTEKVMIKIDTVSQWFKYNVKKMLLEKFEVSTVISIADLSQLLSFKINAFLSRCKWRDIFDLCFILANTKRPDRSILKKLDIYKPIELKNIMLDRIKNISLVDMQKDVRYFVFNENDVRVLKFWEIIKQINFEE